LSVWIVAKKNGFHQSENHLKINATHLNNKTFFFNLFCFIFFYNLYLFYLLFIFLNIFFLISAEFLTRAGLEFKEFRFFFHDYHFFNVQIQCFFEQILMGFAFSTMIFRKTTLNFNLKNNRGKKSKFLKFKGWP